MPNKRPTTVSIEPYRDWCSVERPIVFLVMRPGDAELAHKLRVKLNKIGVARRADGAISLTMLSPRGGVGDPGDQSMIKIADDTSAARARLFEAIDLIREMPNVRLGSTAWLAGWIIGPQLRSVDGFERRLGILANSQSVLEPWLKGELLVRHRETFTRFHTKLSPAARWMCASVERSGHFTTGLINNNPNMLALASALEADGWVKSQPFGSAWLRAGPLLMNRMSLNEYAWWREAGYSW